MTGHLPPVDDVAFRGALGRFASGVTIVTTVADGIDHALTASAFTSVSLRPPQVLVCIDRKTRFCEPILGSHLWGISILAESGQDVSSQLARRGRPLAHQFDGIAHHRGATGVVLVDDAVAWLECRTAVVHDGGDHVILVGDVVAARVQTSVDSPLLYYRSHYGSLVRSDESEKNYRQQGDA